ncbi:HlyD family secretion protein [Methylobacterium currus]|uniref:HlyD family secretion protein n=1 Tax=Methylobacterium currus TaxID=2051553 RepID=UPI001E35733B|nr:HlyD family efflux transporter periplasmic adaptor subunit [Methylobacterium currus]UHC18084.1 HlyD family secretion protein [Methylobacterium currus]
MTQSSSRSRPQAPHRHRGLVRLSSVSLASVLALLIGTSVLPPLVADQSDRAVVNAPVALLTAPIAGDIAAIPVKAGDSVEPGALLARIANPRVDRTTAIQLDSKVTDLRERALSAERKRLSNLAYLESLDGAIKLQSEGIAQMFRSEIEGLRAKIASAQASAEEKKVLMDRQVNMVSRNVASPDMVKSTSQAYAAAQQEQKAAEAKLLQKTTQLEGLSRKVYAGEELSGLAEITQKRMAIFYDAQRLEIEETELKAALAEQQRLLARENTRMDSLSGTEIRAPGGGFVLNVGASVGRHVTAGDSLAALVDCEQSFVVAIFSYRQGQNLQVGSRVTINGGPAGSQPGTVTEILPKTSDKADAAYAVPFPQTERRELYVLVKPDPAPAPATASSALPANSCGVGRWVSVTREAGWVPSTSMLWRSVGDHAASLVTQASTVVTAALKPLTAETVIAATEPAPAAPAGPPPQDQAKTSPQAPAVPSPQVLSTQLPAIAAPETTASTVPAARAAPQAAGPGAEAMPLPPQRPQEFGQAPAEPKRARREQRAER